jgi:hypothetical protein
MVYQNLLLDIRDNRMRKLLDLIDILSLSLDNGSDCSLDIEDLAVLDGSRESLNAEGALGGEGLFDVVVALFAHQVNVFADDLRGKIERVIAKTYFATEGLEDLINFRHMNGLIRKKDEQFRRYAL